MTANFGTVFVENVPHMGLSERDQARRFITFIDGMSPSGSSHSAHVQHAMNTRLIHCPREPHSADT